MSIYATCAAAHGEDDRLVMQCISNWVEEKSIYSYDHQAELHTWLLLLAGSMVFFMQVRSPAP